MTDAPTIFVIDRITARPGLGEALLERYLREYVPVAEKRGFTLVHRWVAPPVWLMGTQGNVLTFIWSVEGVANYWEYIRQQRTDPGSGDWWHEIEPMVAERTRSVASEPADMGRLADV